METFSRETIDPTYVTGFVDGVGTFTYSRSAKQISLYFAIKLMAADTHILQQIQAFFGGVGNIYELHATRSTRYLRVSRRDELLKIVHHFDHHPLQTSKRHSYAIWREMVLLKQQFRRPDRARLDDLAARLSDCRLGDT